MPFLAHRYDLLLLAGTPRHGRSDAGIPRLYLLAPDLLKFVVALNDAALVQEVEGTGGHKRVLGRCAAGPTLPAGGLCLEHVEYDVCHTEQRMHDENTYQDHRSGAHNQIDE